VPFTFWRQARRRAAWNEASGTLREHETEPVPIARKIDIASKMILIKLMERQLVISSELHSVGYDDASNVLEVQFQTGGVYRYFGVPPNVHAALLAAESKGRFFNTVIKPRYQYQRIG
jgi:hypothetical protein